MAYLRGHFGLPVDPSTGLRYLQNASLTSDPDCPQSSYIFARIQLGQLPHLAAEDPSLTAHPASQALERAAWLGFVPAMVLMGYSWQGGFKGYDSEVALRYFHLASRNIQHKLSLGTTRDTEFNGTVEAEISKWFLCGSEDHFKPNEEWAYKFAVIASEQNNSVAQFALGYFYEVGIYVEESIEKALEWYRISRDEGCKDAEDRLNALRDLTRKLTRKDHERTMTIKGRRCKKSYRQEKEEVPAVPNMPNSQGVEDFRTTKALPKIPNEINEEEVNKTEIGIESNYGSDTLKMRKSKTSPELSAHLRDSSDSEDPTKVGSNVVLVQRRKKLSRSRQRSSTKRSGLEELKGISISTSPFANSSSPDNSSKMPSTPTSPDYNASISSLVEDLNISNPGNNSTESSPPSNVVSVKPSDIQPISAIKPLKFRSRMSSSRTKLGASPPRRSSAVVRDPVTPSLIDELSGSGSRSIVASRTPSPVSSMSRNNPPRPRVSLAGIPVPSFSSPASAKGVQLAEAGGEPKRALESSVNMVSPSSEVSHNSRDPTVSSSPASPFRPQSRASSTSSSGSPTRYSVQLSDEDLTSKSNPGTRQSYNIVSSSSSSSSSSRSASPSFPLPAQSISSSSSYSSASRPKIDIVANWFKNGVGLRKSSSTPVLGGPEDLGSTTKTSNITKASSVTSSTPIPDLRPIPPSTALSSPTFSDLSDFSRTSTLSSATSASTTSATSMSEPQRQIYTIPESRGPKTFDEMGIPAAVEEKDDCIIM